NLYSNQALSLPTQTDNFDVLNFQIEDEKQKN
ncbi:TetR/AcrR family transcriptional regulator, partial [Acinetobacter geminorum]